MCVLNCAICRKKKIPLNSNDANLTFENILDENFIFLFFFPIICDGKLVTNFKLVILSRRDEKKNDKIVFFIVFFNLDSTFCFTSCGSVLNFCMNIWMKNHREFKKPIDRSIKNGQLFVTMFFINLKDW